jgi:hypothetical protein
MGLTRVEHLATQKETPNWNTLLEGLRFVWSRPVVLGAISLDWMWRFPALRRMNRFPGRA